MTDSDKAKVIIAEVCRYYKTSYEVIKVKCRRRIFVEPRQVIMYEMLKYTALDPDDIGFYFFQDRCTVFHAKRTVTNLIETGGLEIDIKQLERQIDDIFEKARPKREKEIEKFSVSITQF